MMVDKIYFAAECNPIEGSQKTHWAEIGGNGGTALDDKREQRHVEGTRRCLSNGRNPHRSR